MALLVVVGLCVGAIYLAVRAWRWAMRWRVQIGTDYRDDIVVKVVKGLMTDMSYNGVEIARVSPRANDFERLLKTAKTTAQARCNELNRAR